jgi:hypothetical protein
MKQRIVLTSLVLLVSMQIDLQAAELKLATVFSDRMI